MLTLYKMREGESRENKNNGKNKVVKFQDDSSSNNDLPFLQISFSIFKRFTNHLGSIWSRVPY